MAAQFAASGPARETTPGRGMDGVSVLSPKKKNKRHTDVTNEI